MLRPIRYPVWVGFSDGVPHCFIDRTVSANSNVLVMAVYKSAKTARREYADVRRADLVIRHPRGRDTMIERTGLWGALWRQKGERGHILGDKTIPVLFLTRREAEQWIRQHYGYILKRPDLRRPPHSWRLPKAVRVRVTTEP